MEYILNTTKYDDYFAIINKETGDEMCKINKRVNTVEGVLKQFPELEIEQTGADSKKENDIYYKDGKWYDSNGTEYESDTEYYERNKD